MFSLQQLLRVVHTANASRKSQLQAAYANLWSAKHLVWKSEVSQVQICRNGKKRPCTCLSRPTNVTVDHLCHACIHCSDTASGYRAALTYSATLQLSQTPNGACAFVPAAKVHVCADIDRTLYCLVAKYMILICFVGCSLFDLWPALKKVKSSMALMW